MEKNKNKKPNLSSQQQKHIEKHVKTHLTKHLPKHLDKHLISRNDYYASQIKQHTTTAIIAAFSFLMALVWKDFFVKIISEIMDTLITPPNTHLTNLYSAVIVTILAVLGIITVVKWTKKPHVLISESQTD
jgi:hypothetical protein